MTSTAPLVDRSGIADLVLGWALAEGVAIGPSDEGLRAALREAVADVGARGLAEPVRAAVRDLLRGHGYKPTGRGKPASEFLASAAERGEFPEILNAVDINNLVSLRTGLPISIFDLDAALAGASGLEARIGRTGESFVFNPAGHTIDVTGLLSVARVEGEPIGNPVKDSMATKIGPDTRRVLAVVYGSRRICDAPRMAQIAAELATLLREHAAAASVASGVLAAGA